MMTACGGERRFASCVAKKLQALGALTKGDRRAADAADLSAFDVDTKWGKRAMDCIIDELMQPGVTANSVPPAHVRSALGLRANDELQEKWQEYLEEAEDAIAGAGIDDKTPNVKKFLNRLLGMPVEMQNRVFAHFSANFEFEVKKAKEEHKFDEGVVDIRGDVHIQPGYPVVLETDQTSGVALQHVLMM